MRMDPNQKVTAYDIISSYREDQLVKIFFELGEEPYSRQIAKKIVKTRKKNPIKTTNDLLEVVKSALPPKYRFGRKHGHYASKVFRAIRMEVNQELDVLREVLPQAVQRLNPSGRLVVISFHSLEDRIVKHYFRELKQADRDQDKETVNILTKKPVMAKEDELNENPRSSSAKLRAIEVLA